ncbi:histidine phosphatase family protein [Paenibacillus sp. FSL P2-0089]|uniref:histidine phosphatase family protein n=1 Tax=Paenibacillus sp. FSL P2-0089 TaxID=2954526 RepID=UPI00315AA8F6
MEKVGTQSPQTNPAQLELVLVRHGYTQWNQERRYLGRTDVTLMPGEAERLKRLRAQPPLGGEFRRVYCSDLRRCRETLEALVPHLMPQAIYDSRLREMDFGAWEGCRYDQLKDNPLYRSWIDNPGSVTPPEGETWEQFAVRVDHFWAQLLQEVAAAVPARVGTARASAGAESIHPADPPTEACDPETTLLKPDQGQVPAVFRVMLVTHGGVIRQLLARIIEGVTFYTAAAPAPGEVTVLHLRKVGGSWRMAAENANG